MLDAYDYNEWYEEEWDDSTVKDDEEELDDLRTLEDDKEAQERKELEILTPKKLLTRYWVLLAQIKAQNHSCKLRNKIRQIV